MGTLPLIDPKPRTLSSSNTTTAVGKVNELFFAAQQTAEAYAAAATGATVRYNSDHFWDAYPKKTITFKSIEDTASVEAGVVDLGNINALIFEEMELGLAPVVHQAEPISLREDSPEFSVLDSFVSFVDTNVENVLLPTLTAIAPEITIPEKPTDTLPDFDEIVVNQEAISIPTLGNISLPNEPAFNNVAIPTAREIVEVPFEKNMPEAILDEPTVVFAFSETPYNAEVADKVKLWLLNQIGEGGTGLSEEIEAALWARAKERDRLEIEDKYEEATKYWSARGHEEPPGALRGRLRKLNNEITRARQQMNFEIMIEQGRLAQTNTHFVLEKSLAYEQIMLDYINKVNDRALMAAKSQVDAEVAIYNAKVAYYNMQLDAYKTYAQVFEMKVRAELAKIEIFKAEMEGAKVAQEVENMKVQLYESRIKAALSLIEVFRAELDAAKTKVEINKSYLDVARLNVEQKVAQIQGITAKYNLYQTEVTAQKSLVDMYGQQVGAYKTQVDAASVEATVKIERGKHAIEQNKQKIELLDASVKKYEADIAELKSMNEAYIGKAQADSSKVEASVAHYNAYTSALIGHFKARIDAASAELRGYAEQATNFTNASIETARISQASAESIAKVQAQIAASALSSISATASIGYSGSNSQSISEQNSRSLGRNDSNQNSYQESA